MFACLKFSICAVCVSYNKRYLQTWQPFAHPASISSVEQGGQLVSGNGNEKVKMSEKLPSVPRGHCGKSFLKCQTLNWPSRGGAYYPS